MAVRIAEGVHDENGHYINGRAGDQTGDEVRIRNYYNMSANVVVRFNDANMREKMAYGMERAANNSHIGYDQKERNTVYTQASKVGWDMGAIGVDCEGDCSSIATVASIYAGCNANIMYQNNCATTSTLRERLQQCASVTIYTNSAYTRSSNNLMRGDIVIREGHHVFVVLSNGSNAVTTPASSIDLAALIALSKLIVKKGQKHANEFVNHDRIAEDGVNGPNTKRMAARVLQHAMNLDYGVGLVEDGLFGDKSRAALGNHYVEYGEKQYMVTAAEILYELKCNDPNGVEYPGVYGNGLKKASNKSRINASDFLALLN